eukprot:PhM_4_TR11647/c4_g2_i1/m.68094
MVRGEKLFLESTSAFASFSEEQGTVTLEQMRAFLCQREKLRASPKLDRWIRRQREALDWVQRRATETKPLPPMWDVRVARHVAKVRFAMHATCAANVRNIDETAL